MPYPDHFARNRAYRPWEHPYETLLDWAESAAKRQAETPTPAVDRTWIQAYNAIQPPYNEYGVQEIGDEIRALREEGLTGEMCIRDSYIAEHVRRAKVDADITNQFHSVVS